MKHTILTLIVLMLAESISAQNINRKKVSFKIDGERLSMPTAGGIRSPQISNIDLDGDGELDVLIFDRDGGVVIPMIRDGEHYVHAPEYQTIFPAATSWMLLRDYDHDGIEDVFCSPTTASIAGVEVWKGNRSSDGSISYTKLTFPERDYDLLYIPLGSSATQVYVSSIDMPSIEDVDDDGDLDILAFEPGGSTIYWYRNMAIEKNLPLSDLVYELGDICYGKFVESGFSEMVDLSTNPDECANHNGIAQPIIETRHSGSTVASIDLDDSGRMDLLVGDISYDGLVSLTQDEMSPTPWMTDQLTHWPPSQPVNMRVYNAAYPIDYLGKSSIIVSPNDPYAGQWDEHIWLYQKQETGDYRLIKKDAFINDMVHLGKNTVPIFFDENGDGLIDIIVGSSGHFVEKGVYSPRLSLFQNVGTPKHPAYELIDADWMGFSQYANNSEWFAPALGDIDGDGDIDLVIGDDEGHLYFAENSSNDSTSFVSELPIYQAFGIKVSAWAIPHIFDYNGDGKADLLIGEQNFNSHEGKLGSLNYYENKVPGAIGIEFDPEVNNPPNNPAFGGIYLRDNNSVNNYSAPTTYHDGINTVLVTANESGALHVYSDINKQDHTSDFHQDKVWDRAVFYEGRRATLSLADIDRDSRLEIVIGNSRGGIAIYDTDLPAREVMDSTDDPAFVADVITISPSPASDKITISTDILKPIKLTIYNMAGQLIRVSPYTSILDVNDLAAGTYVAEVSNEYKSASTYFIKID